MLLNLKGVYSADLEYFLELFVIGDLKCDFKEIVSVISSELPFKERNLRFTTVPFNPLTGHRRQRTQCKYLLTVV